MWIFLVEITGVVMALGGWLGMHSFPFLLIGSLLIVVFDMLMSSSGGQLKPYGISVFLLAAGAIIGKLTAYGILTTALLFFSLFSAGIVLFKLILLMLAVFDKK